MNVPSSDPVKPPRRAPRPPLPPLGAGSAGASFGASRFPDRGFGFSAVFGGGDGSRSESWSLVFPTTKSEGDSKRQARLVGITK